MTAPLPKGLVAAACAIAAAGCTQTVVLERPGGNDGGLGGAGFPGAGGTILGVGGAGGVPWIPGGCPNGPLQSLSPKLRTAELVLAVDRSSSMNTRFASDGSTRLAVVQATLLQMIGKYQKAIWFGYEEFPVQPSSSCLDTSGCCAGAVDTFPQAQSEVPISRSMNDCVTMGGCIASDSSPMAGAISQILRAYNLSHDDVNDRYVLVLTDGEPTCAPDGDPDPMMVCLQTQLAIDDLSSAGVRTFVFGIGDDIAPRTCLDDLALAGGEAQGQGQQQGAPYYYPARDPQSLNANLTSVMTTLARSVCRINLRSPSASDPSSIRVQIAGKDVAWDPTDRNGWNFDPGSSTRITIFGAACDMLQAADTRDVEVLGCPTGPQH